MCGKPLPGFYFWAFTAVMAATQTMWLLSPVLVTAFCIAMIYFFDVPMTVQRRLKVMTVVHAVWCVLSLVLSLWLVPGMGIAGVNLVLMMTAGGDAITLGILAFQG